MDNDNEQPVSQKDVKKNIPPALPIPKQIELKNDIRLGFSTFKTTIQMVKEFSAKYNIGERTVYGYIQKVTKEDIKAIDRNHIVEDVLAGRIFRRRQLLGLYSNETKKEEETRKAYEEQLKLPVKERNKFIFPYYATRMKTDILKQLADEDKVLVDLLQQLSIIDKPVNKVLTNANIDVNMKNYTFVIEEVDHSKEIEGKIINGVTTTKQLENNMESNSQTEISVELPARQDNH